MAIFLLIYVIFVIIWLAWLGILLYHAYKYRFPNDKQNIIIYAFLGLCVFILIVSIIFISRADWVTVPKMFGGK